MLLKCACRCVNMCVFVLLFYVITVTQDATYGLEVGEGQDKEAIFVRFVTACGKEVLWTTPDCSPQVQTAVVLCAQR